VRQSVNMLRAHPTSLPSVDGTNPGRILSKVFAALDLAGISYCVLHGYEHFPNDIKSDVDCLIDANVSARELLRLLHENRLDIGADVVHCRGHYIVLAGKGSDGSHCFLTLDFAADCDLQGVRYFDGSEILATRRRHGIFWIPAPDLEFAAYLVRTISRGSLNDQRAGRLSNIYRQDPEGCANQIARFCIPEHKTIITAAAQFGHWDAVRAQLASFNTRMRSRAIRRRPIRFVANKLRAWADRVTRMFRPDGISVAFLGPDGAGKSSVISALPSRLTPVFARHDCWGFAPGILNAFRSGERATDQPHALKSRSLPVSLLRLGYWFGYHTYSYLNFRLVLARSTLLLHDRSFIDILVDQKRYRYGGPVWMLRLVWRLAPKPDLVILLDASPEILQRRKQEVSYEVTVRQRQAYVALVGAMPSGRVIDAGAPLAQVVESVTEVILEHLRKRLLRRFDFDG
jgi:thymidylate kinase